MLAWHGGALEPPCNRWLGVTAENQEMWDVRVSVLKTIPAAVRFVSVEPMLGAIDMGDLTGISWVICGGENGPGARPTEHEWFMSILNQCEKANVPFFFKGCGDWAKKQISIGNRYTSTWLDGCEWREFPQARG
jgi:protein gp37